MGRRGRRSSWAQPPRSAGAGSIRPARRSHRGESSGSRCPRWGPATPGARHPSQTGSALPPRPFLSVETSGRSRIEQSIVLEAMHLRCRLSPSRARLPYRTHHEPAWFGVKLHLIAELRLLQQGLRNPNAAGVADSHDSGGGRHGDHIVVTLAASGNRPAEPADALVPLFGLRRADLRVSAGRGCWRGPFLTS